ncbi:hypothetical protein Acr_10g0007990 [Actinidia rufa]|uniref:Uncharacterized protein n=1 Tax=Actinidia rufa TaxID=165716 RepID=A0A7J0F9N7_9ERIC|nr:hypothetical protein Acr_10g0007990 [Actinidia rufa]
MRVQVTMIWRYSNAQEKGQDEETVHEIEQEHDGVHMGREYPMHGVYPSQEGKTKQRQEEIIQNQARQEQYIDRLGDIVEKHGQYIDRIRDLYENLYGQHTTFNQQQSHQLAKIEAQLKGLWVHVIATPPYAPGDASPHPPYRTSPY